MIKPVFRNIQNEIQSELFKAAESIRIAVAWFTNDLLFQILLMKLQIGVKVEIVLNDDAINRESEHHLDFDKYIKAGGKIYWRNDKNLMHQKFCIVDNKTVINGSYNWTYKAEYNDENINIIYDDKQTATQFINEFYKLCNDKSIVKGYCAEEESKFEYDTSVDTETLENAEYDEYGVGYNRARTKLLIDRGSKHLIYEIPDGINIICDKALLDDRIAHTVPL